jgi:hypothetical protein
MTVSRYRVDLGALRMDIHYNYIQRQMKVIDKIQNAFRQSLDPDRQHTHWCVSDWFGWDSASTSDENYALLIKKMDGGSPPQPTGDEWIYGICFSRRGSPYYHDFNTKVGNTTTLAARYFMYGWDCNTNMAVDSDGCWFVRHSLVNFREVELAVTSWGGAPFTLGEYLTDADTQEKVGEVVWIDGGNPLHIRVQMKTGLNFETGEILEKEGDVSDALTVIDEYQWNIELTGVAWALGGPFIVGDTVYDGATEEKIAVVKWVDPDDDRHIRVLSVSGPRFRAGDDIAKDPGNILAAITINDANMHDVGFEDNILGINSNRVQFNVRNINNNGGADFTQGEKVVSSGGGEATFNDWNGTWRNRMMVNYAVGNFRPGDIISTDRGGPPDATAIVMPTGVLHTWSGASGTFEIGEEIYTSTASGFLVQDEGSTKLFYRTRMDLVSTDFGGLPVQGDVVQDVAGTKFGVVASTDTSIPGQMRWTVLCEEDPFLATEDIQVEGDPLVYVNDVAIQNHEQGTGMFFANQTLYGRTSGATITTQSEDWNYYNSYFVVAKSLYSEIEQFFPRARNSLYNNAMRGVYDRCYSYDAYWNDHSAVCMVFEWDRPFMMAMRSAFIAPYAENVYLLGEIIQPLQGKRADPNVYATLCMNLTAASSTDVGGIDAYRLEALYGFGLTNTSSYNLPRPILTTFTIYQRTFLTWWNSIRNGNFMTGTWDWDLVTIANGSEFKGYLHPDLFRVIGYYHYYDYQKVFEDFNDPTKVVCKTCTNFSLPWVKDEPIFPPWDWETYDMDFLYRERY